MTFKIHKEVFIRAAHYLRGYPKNCKRLHGEYYRIRVWIESEELDKYGMVIDFKDLTKWIKKYDHKCLNDIKPFDKINPTVESFALNLGMEIKKELNKRDNVPYLTKIRIYESDSSFCEINYEK